MFKMYYEKPEAEIIESQFEDLIACSYNSDGSTDVDPDGSDPGDM